MKRSLVAAAILAITSTAHAVPVPVGRLGVSLHAGLDPLHPMAAERGGPERTGRLRGRLPETEPRVVFDVGLEGAHPRGPIVDRDGRIFVGTAHGVLGLSPTGEIVFDQRLGAIDVAPALLPGGELVVITRDRQLLRMSRDGEIQASRTIDASVRAAPLVLADGSLVIAALDRTVIRYDSDLTERFRIVLDEGSPTSPTLAPSGHVIVGAGAGLSVLDVDLGVVLGQVALPGRAVGATIAALDGTLFQLTVDGTVVAVSAEAHVQWERALGGRAYEGTAIALAADGTLRIAIPTVGVICVGPEGEERWTFSTDAPFYGTVAVDEAGSALAVDRRGRLTVIDAAGALDFRVELGVPVAAAAIAPHQLVIASDRPSVMAFALP